LGHCPVCTERIICACLSCGRRLRGSPRSTVLRRGGAPEEPSPHRWNACESCGEPYPWGTREARISYLRRRLRSFQITDQERETLNDDLAHLQLIEKGDDSEAEGRVAGIVKRIGTATLVDALGGVISDLVMKQFFKMPS
jgi:hypothetical protein